MEVYKYIKKPLTLDVDKRFAIANNVCKGMCKIHSKMEGEYIIHQNINSFTILLDEKWESKLSGFEYSIKHSFQRRNQILYSKAIVTKGYMDPNIEKYGGVNHKSDIYSFGVVLFELLCGKKAFQKNTLLAPLAKYHYENGTLENIIHPEIWRQMNPKSFKCFSEAAYSCLQEDPTLRPNSDQLEDQLSEASRLQHEKDEVHQMKKEPPIFENLLDILSPDMWKVKVTNWEHLRIKLTHIHSPPPPYLVSNARYHKYPHNYTFKQEIEYYDREYVSLVEQKNNKDEVLKRVQTVSAKLVLYEKDVFLREIEILDKCRHPNIQSFVGFYHNGDKMMLFYEYVSDKNLHHILDDVNFTWGKRLKICIDVAQGLDYLHNGMEDQKMVIHGELDTNMIELDDNFVPKIVGFGKSIIANSNSLKLNGGNKNEDYIDKLKREDVLSFGLVMCEILCGKYLFREIRNLSERRAMMQQLFDEGTIKEKLAIGIKEENYGNILFLKKGPNEVSLYTFREITYKCLAESDNERPGIKVIIKELQKALYFHENHKDSLRMSFNDINLATRNFSHANIIGRGGFGHVYKGKLEHSNVNGHSTIVVKKLDKSKGQGEKEYYNELQILSEYNHKNVINLIGYNDENNENLIVYEHASKGSLNMHLNNVTLRWRDRLKICIDIATALNFLHEGTHAQEVVIHRDIKSDNILLFDDWKAKLGDFGLSLRSTMNEKTNFSINHPCGTEHYMDPMYLKSSILTKSSDVYSFGVALLEILSGKPIDTLLKDTGRFSLINFMNYMFESKKKHEVVFKDINEEIKPRSLTTFLNIIYQCLNDNGEIRPTIRKILRKLKKALEFQDEKNKEDGKNEEDEKNKKAEKDVQEKSSNSWKVKVKKWRHLRLGLTDIANSDHSRSLGSIQNRDLQMKEIECYDRKYVYLKNIYELPKTRYRVARKMVTYKEDVILKEIDILDNCKHPNIQSLIGFYDESSTKMLFYEFVSFKFLHQFLNDDNLTWRRRLKICIDVAQGLNYLQNEMKDGKMVIHGDISCENIELDDTWGAKIVGFEKSTIFHSNKENHFIELSDPFPDANNIHYDVLSYYYLDPEHAHKHKLTKKSEVFSFGVIMLEILCGTRLPNVKMDRMDRFIMQKYKFSYFAHLWQRDGTIKQKLSPVIAREEHNNEDSLNTFIGIMYDCLTKFREERPNMKVVIEELQKALAFHDKKNEVNEEDVTNEEDKKNEVNEEDATNEEDKKNEVNEEDVTNEEDEKDEVAERDLLKKSLNTKKYRKLCCLG